MIIDSNINTDLNSAIFLMATMSPRVRDSIDLELYRATADSDGSTQQYVLEDAFVCFLNDLQTIGLKFEVDYSDYCENAGLLFPFIRVCSYLLPNTLYELIRTDYKIRTLITDIVNGNLGDNETSIQIYLTELGGLEGHPALVPELSDYINEIYQNLNQTEVFSDYLKNMIELNNSEKLMNESDEEAHLKYNLFLKKIIGDLSDAVNKYSDKPYFDELLKIQNFIIRDLTAPENFHEYCYLFLENEHTLPSNIIPLHQRKWFYYLVSHRWCSDYYIYRQNEIASYTDMTMILCFNYAISETKEQFQEAMLKTKELIALKKTDLHDTLDYTSVFDLYTQR